MKTTIIERLIIFGLIFQSVNSMAQGDGWKTKTTDGGKITVSYRISEKLDENGKKNLFIEDSTTSTVDNISIDKFISLMKDISKHKEFTGDYLSKEVKAISANEWIIYYYTKNPWPIDNSDCVMKMTFTENKEQKTAIFNLVATPTEYEKTNLNRAFLFNLVYIFQDLGNGKIKIIVNGKSSPPVKVPVWLVKAAFPGAPSGAVRKLIKLAQNNITNI